MSSNCASSALECCSRRVRKGPALGWGEAVLLALRGAVSPAALCCSQGHMRAAALIVCPALACALFRQRDPITMLAILHPRLTLLGVTRQHAHRLLRQQSLPGPHQGGR